MVSVVTPWLLHFTTVVEEDAAAGVSDVHGGDDHGGLEVVQGPAGQEVAREVAGRARGGKGGAGQEVARKYGKPARGGAWHCECQRVVQGPQHASQRRC